VSPTTTEGEERLVALLAEAGRGPKRDGLYALWLVVRAAEALLGQDRVSPKNHRRRLQAIALRLGGLALPAPLKRALIAARQHLETATPEAAVDQPHYISGGMSPRRFEKRPSLEALVHRVDRQRPGELGGDTIPTGFPSVDKLLGGGVRRRDLIMLGGDVGAGKSALALGIALRVAQQELPVALLSGEMDEERLMERALAIEGRVAVDELRAAKMNDQMRAGIGAAAVRLRGLPLTILPLAPLHDLALVVVDYLQLVPAPASGARGPQDEELAQVLRRLKAVALERQVALLVVAQLPKFNPDRENPRPTLDDFGHLGAIKQHADVVLGIFREEMYRPGGGVEGATELLVAKNRNGPTGFVDLYFYRRWMRFEDMLDPDR